MSAVFDEAQLRRQILAGNGHLARAAAVANEVCSRPMVAYVANNDTGERRRVAIPCGATIETRCPACAARARRLRMHQCREGWHRTVEPLLAADLQEMAATNGWYDLPPVWEPLADTDDEVHQQDEDDEPGGDADACPFVPEEDPGRRVRSTRRRQDAPDLPKVPMREQTTGRMFKGRDGKVWRPSMFLTLTLPSYGAVTREGAPRRPDDYDYRTAALDALHFPKLVDRFWQNLRRCAGYRVQYFATVEPQRRLAPHLHAAIRGAIPHGVFREVVDATYHQLWWPPHDTPVYTDQLPIWDERQHAYINPTSKEPLPSWDQALDALDADPDAAPAHVLRFGGQADSRGLVAGTHEADKTVSYLCKYLTKSIAAAYDDEHDDGEPSQARRAHLERLHDEVRWLPCSPTCANWLRYGTQPQGAGPGLCPGYCKGRAHRRENLGLGGRRVLVSRRWSGKTLTDHRADRTVVVRAALREAGLPVDDHQELSATGTAGAWEWQIVSRNQLDTETYAEVLGELIAARTRWRTQYETARTRAGPGPPPAQMAA